MLRLLDSVTPTNKIRSDISQMYLLRAKAVVLDWRVALLTDIIAGGFVPSVLAIQQE